MKNRQIKLFALVVSLAVLFTSTAYAAESTKTNFTDMPNNWSTTALINAVENGLFFGANGKIMPDENLTRSQMAAIVNRAFGATKAASLESYSDVSQGAWYFKDMAMALQMKTFYGDGTGKLRPDEFVTREQVFAVLARAFKLSGDDVAVLNKFTDSESVSEWAKDYTASLVQAGYVNGSNGKLNPQQYISRAEFAQLMDNMLKSYIKQAGTYSDSKTGNVMISVPNVTLKNITIKGDLIIGDGVGDGEVTLDSVVVEGRTVIRGGGVNSVRIIGSSNAGTVIVSRVDGAVSIKVQGDAKVTTVYVEDGSDDVFLVGAFGDIELMADNVTVTAKEATLKNAAISGDNSRVIVGEGSKVDKIDIIGQGVTISGPGAVSKVNVAAGGNNAKVTTPNTSISVATGVDKVTGGGGEALESGTTRINNTTGTNLVKDSPSMPGPAPLPVTVPLTAVGNISGTVKVSEVLTCGTLTPADASADYQWMVSDTENGTYSEIGSATGTTFTIPSGCTGKFIKVRAAGKGNNSGTVNSAVVGPVADNLVFSITANAGGDTYINSTEATTAAAITVTPTNGTIQSVSVIGVNKSTSASLTVGAALNGTTGKYEFNATGFKDGTLTVKATSTDSKTGETTLVLDTLAAKLITGGQLVALTGTSNPLSIVKVVGYAFPSAGDINGDGRLDVVVGDTKGHIITYYQQVGGAYAVASPDPLASVFTGETMFTFPGLGDIDKDGDLDLVVSLTTGYVQYYKNTGSTTNPIFTIQEGDTNPFKTVFNPLYAFNTVGDVDGDKDADVLFGYDKFNLSGTKSLELWKNDGHAVFTKSTDAYAPFSNYNTTAEHSFVVPFLGDFNGDGKLDAGVYSYKTHTIEFYEGNGAGVYTPNETQNPFSGISYTVPFASAGDIDGDGDSDFLIGDNGGTIRVFQNNVGEAVVLASSQISAGQGTGNVTTNDTSSLALSGKGAESSAKIALYVDGNLLTDAIQANVSGAWTLTWRGNEPGFPIISGNKYSLTVKQTDVAGNISEISLPYYINIAAHDE